VTLTNKEYAAELRKLAEVYDNNEDVAQIYEGTVVSTLLFCHDPKTAAATVKAFGSADKVDAGDSIKVTPRKEVVNLNLVIHVFKDRCCHRVVKGKKILPARVMPAKPATKAYIIPEREVEEVEWVCPPILAGGVE